MTLKILAIDTATDACSAALNIDHEVHEIYKYAPKQHAQLLLSMIDKLLSDAKIKLSQLDAIALSHGPGAFTGIHCNNRNNSADLGSFNLTYKF
jgi:tRNA threonylcarbamoyladenosine biosynthesis protein TsaB